MTQTGGNGQKAPTPIAELPLSRTSTIIAAIISGAAFLAGAINQALPFVPPKYHDLFVYVGGLAAATAAWRGRVATKQAAVESATVAAAVATDVATVQAASVPPVVVTKETN